MMYFHDSILLIRFIYKVIKIYFKVNHFSGVVVWGSQRTGIDFKGFFLKLVSKFKKMAGFRKSIYELAQTLGNKRKNARKRRFTLNGDPSESQVVRSDKSLKLCLVFIPIFWPFQKEPRGWIGVMREHFSMKIKCFFWYIFKSVPTPCVQKR